MRDKGKDPRAIERALSLDMVWNKEPLFRGITAKQFIEAEQLARTWESSPLLRKYSPQTLQEARNIVVAWTKTQTLRYRSVMEIERAFAKIRDWEKSSSGKKGGQGNLKTEYVLLKEWTSSPVLRPLSPQRLKECIALAEAGKNIPLNTGSSALSLDKTLTLCAAWKRHPVLRNHNPQAILEAQAMALAWKLDFGGAQPLELEAALARLEVWRRHPALRDRKPEQLQRDLERAEMWNSMPALRGKDAKQVEKALALAEGSLAKAQRTPEARKATLFFDGKRLYWNQQGKDTSWPAYSGREEMWRNKRFSIDDQKMKNVGPLPEGLYIVRQSEYQTHPLDPWIAMKGSVGEGTWPGGAYSWGDRRVWIYPHTDTEVYGRSGFSIHGGSEPGSAGCIDLVGNMHIFAELFLAYGKDMQLEARYPETHEVHTEKWGLPQAKFSHHQ